LAQGRPRVDARTEVGAVVNDWLSRWRSKR
jgi:hypothetical protein